MGYGPLGTIKPPWTFFFLIHKLTPIRDGARSDNLEHSGRNCFNLFQITADADPEVSGVSNDQKFCEKFKKNHCQVDHPAQIEQNQKPLKNT